MKKNILIVSYIVIFISMLNASDIPFFKSLFMSDEEYVKQEILKCKDVESVEIILVDYDSYDDDKTYEIHVYLSNHRYLSFDNVDLAFYKSAKSYKNQYILLKQINDLSFWEEAFKPYRLGKHDLEYTRWSSFGEIRFLEQLSSNFNAGNISEIIENIDSVYNFVKSLPKTPEEAYKETPKFKYSYGKSLIIPKEFENEVPFSVFEKKQIKIYDDDMIPNLKEYENAYKFFQVPIENAKVPSLYITDY